MNTNNENRKEIINAVLKERDYQDHFCTIQNMNLKPTIEGELVMLKKYIDKTLNLWTENPGDKKVLSEIRKLSAIGIRCLENHGCPKRDFLKGMINGD